MPLCNLHDLCVKIVYFGGKMKKFQKKSLMKPKTIF